jgi:stage III sporulation protein AD
MEIVLKAAAVSVAAAILSLVIKKTNPELSLVLGLAVCALIAGFALKAFAEVKDTLELVELGTGFSADYAAPILKCVGIAMASRFGSDICRDAGQSAAGSALESCGAVCALYVSLPLLKELLRTIGALT